MAKLLFSLRNVPDDEADDVRELLEQNHIDFYETSAGNWGISVPAIWLQDKTEYPRAKSLIDDYQKKRFIQQRAVYEQLKREGKHRTLTDIIKENPLRFILYIIIILVLLYFSTRPFINLG
jgi:hypothetical protein